MAADDLVGSPDLVPDPTREPEIYVGAFAFDPSGRLVKIVEVAADHVVTQITVGSYCAKTRYPPSVLRAWRKARG